MSEVLTFRPTFLETVRAFRAIGSSVGLVRWLDRAGWMLPPAALVLGVAFPALTGLAAALLLLGILLLALGTLSPLVGAWRARYESPTAHAERVVTIDERGLLTRAAGATTFLSWSDVVRVSETPRLLLVHTSAHAAAFLPKRAFASGASLDAVRALARTRAGRPADPALAPPAPGEDLGPVRLTASFRSGVAELFHAERALRRHGSLRWSTLLLIGLIVLLLLIPVYGDLSRNGWSGVEWGAHLAGILPLIVLVAVAHPLLLLWAAWSQLRTSRVAGQEQRIRVGERGLRAEGPFSAGSARWDAVVRVVETRHFFLFYLNGETGLALPKRAITPDQAAATREFLAGKLGFNFLEKG